MPQISFEFFPPQTPRGNEALARTAGRLAAFGPSFYSVTYGAGGSTRDRTFATVAHLRGAGYETAPHLSWGGGEDEADLLRLVENYRQLGVDRLVALRGDAPADGGAAQVRHAEELVRLLRRRVDAPLSLWVAAYPEVHPDAPSASADVEFLKRKVDAGADGCITQYFYNADGYFHFRDRCAAAGVDAPIVPGVMPIADVAKLTRFSAKAGAEIPRWIAAQLAELDGDDEAVIAFGADVVTGLCERLLDAGAPGLHFYTLNSAEPTATIAGSLRLGAD